MANQEDLQDLRRELKNARIKLRNLILASKRKAWSELMQSIGTDPWGKPFKTVTEKFRKFTTPVTKTMSKELLNSVLDYLFPDKNNTYPMVTPGEEDIFNEISREELEHAVRKVKNGVSPGPDGISSELITRAFGNVRDTMRSIFNRCLASGHFPKIWKEGRLVLIKKPTKPEDQPSSYRPICVLNETGKIFERILVQRIEEHLTGRGPDIVDDQYGFRKNRSTVDAILEFKTRIGNIVERGWYAVAVSLDISNAFNSIPWDVINEEMEAKNFPKTIRAIIRSYLEPSLTSI